MRTIRVSEVAGLRRSGRADEVTFRAFVEPHWAVMERLARRLAPEGQWDDTLQDALLTAWRKRSQYDPARGTARTWLLAVVADKAYKRHRGRHPVSALSPDAAVVAADRSATLDVRAAVALLPSRQRTAVVLFYYLDLPTAEIAQIMGCAIGTVKSTLADGRRGLQTYLGEDYSHARP